jgi:protein-tyrosine-phosphatase
MKRVLFVCTWNAIRSPMAAALLKTHRPGWHVESAGVHMQPVNPFAVTVLDEIGLNLRNHISRSLQDVTFSPAFDCTISLSESACKALSDCERSGAGPHAHWPVKVPSYMEGNRDQQLERFRAIRDELATLISKAF